MHAIANQAAPVAQATHSCLVSVADVRPGQTFIRTDSPSEVLALMTFAGADAHDGKHAWGVVMATNHDSEGYVLGQLLKLRRSMLVRLVHEARAPVYALEQ